MTDDASSSDRPGRYRFSPPGGPEVKTREFSGDGAAEIWAHELSKSHVAPIIIHRHEGGDDWAYVTEVDDRP